MKIRDIAFATPSHRVDSEEIATWADMDFSFVRDKIGVKSRAFLEKNESTLDLALKSCNALFEKNSDLQKESIELLILVTQNPDYKLPHTSALLQDHLGINVETACFDVNLGCSGYVYALTIAKAIMVSEEMSNALLVTCDPYSRIMGKRDRDTIALFGDASTATWLSDDKGARIGRLDAGTDGKGAQSLIVQAGGSKNPLHSVWSDQEERYTLEDFHLHMNGKAIFNFMMERVYKTISRCLGKNSKTLEEIDYFVFHQASRFLIETLRRKMNLPEEKVPINITDLGNTVSSTIPIMLSQMMDRKALSNRTVLISGFGVGLSWATNILFFGD